MAKSAYLYRSLKAQFTSTRFQCPNCGSPSNHIVDRKFVVTQLRRCLYCKLMFRTPTDDASANRDFYENKYVQGFTTEMPSDATISELKRNKFAGTEKDYSYYIDVLGQLVLRPGAKLFDYGCSWVYGSYQLAEAGFNVVAFEVAQARRRYADEMLGVVTVDNMDLVATDLAGQFDCFFSAHVIEHVPTPARSFDYARRLLKPGGLFVSFTPNGSEGHRVSSSNWSKLWGEVHPNFIDDIFLDYNFRLSPRVIGSSPVAGAALPEKCGLVRLDKIDGYELFFAARTNGDAWG
jgi:2-polyprenyl-3-methyl-5-hydroxy-6-metoxy-1,4-benzoquinol methylase